MSDSTRHILAILLAVAGLAWWLGVDLWRGRSQEHSARVFWLHLTAPLVASALMLLAIGLLLGTRRLREARGLPPRPAAGGRPGPVVRPTRPITTRSGDRGASGG